MTGILICDLMVLKFGRISGSYVLAIITLNSSSIFLAFSKENIM